MISQNQMNKKITFLVLIALLAPNLVFGETDTSNSVQTKNEAERQKIETLRQEKEQERTTIKDELETKKENLKQEMEQKKEEVKNTIEERKQNATENVNREVAKFVRNMNERLNAAVNRLVKLADRIDSRIAKMETDKINVTKAKELMVIARAKIETAKASATLVTVATTSTSSTASSTATTTIALIKEAFKVTKAQIEKAKTDIKLAHEALVNVVENLKPGKNKTATTTSESEN